MKRSYSLDLIKLFLAYVIVLFHVDKWVAPGPTVTVQVFFVISGYFLARKYYGRSHNDPEKQYGPWQYTWDHVRPLYPHYLLALVLFLGYALLRSAVQFVQSPGWDSLREMMTLVYDQLPDTVFLQSAYKYGDNLNRPTWQLSAMVIAGYFIYALLCHNEKLSRTVLFPAGILMVQCLLYTGVDLFTQYGCFFLPLLRAFSPMCVGVLTYYFSTTAYYEKLKDSRILFNVLVLLALPAMMAFEDRNDLHLLWSAVLILGCMEQDTWINRLLNKPCFAGCGTLSYVLYLNHAVFGRFYVNILSKLVIKAGIALEDPWYTVVYLVLLTVLCLLLRWFVNRVQQCRRKVNV